MSIQERIMKKAMGDNLPALVNLLDSLHGFTRLNALLHQEQLAYEIMRHQNISLEEARKQAETRANELQNSLEMDK